MTSRPGRVWFIDALRSTMMMLGVVLHSARVFDAEQNWVVHSGRSAPALSYLVAAIHTFRMPTFFVVSGFFCFLTLSRLGVAGFLRVRLARIVIPLVTTALTLNVLQAYVLDACGWRQFEFRRYVLEGKWQSHLWFLVILALYFLMAALVGRLFGQQLAGLRRCVAGAGPAVPAPVLLMLLPIASVGGRAIVRIAEPAVPYWTGALVDPSEFVGYLPFFAFGILLGADPDLFRRFCTTSPLVLLLLGAFGVSLASVGPEGAGFLGKVASLYLETLIVWTSLALCFVLFHAAVTRPGPWPWLADASYSVYLFHHLIVIALSSAAIAYSVPPLAGFLGITATTLALTLALHTWCIAPSPVLSYLFNGRSRA